MFLHIGGFKSTAVSVLIVLAILILLIVLALLVILILLIVLILVLIIHSNFLRFFCGVAAVLEYPDY